MKIMKNDEAVSPGKTVSTEEAVSPVIGVILMVAITVILAAVIAAFVFGLAGSTGTSKNVGLTVAKSGTENFTVTIQGGTDLPQLNKLQFSTNGTFYDLTGPFTVGTTKTFPGHNGTGFTNTGVRLIIKGSFSDGSEQVLWDRQF